MLPETLGHYWSSKSTAATHSQKLDRSAMVRRGSQASDSAALRAAAVLLCVMLFTMDSFATAANVVVGGNAGWTGSHNYGRMTAKSGDALGERFLPYHCYCFSRVLLSLHPGCHPQVLTRPIYTFPFR